MTLSLNNDFGYYTVGEKIFFSKNLAYNEVLASKKRIEYHFNDHIFDKYDWTHEPESEVSIEEFYRRRAQQIRDEYDYVILQYSGGPDSTNILKTFLKNKIKLDEIVNFNSYNSTSVVEGTIHNADYVYNVKPILEKLLKENTQTKVTIVDEIEMTKKIWDDVYFKDYYELLFSSGTFPSFWMMRGIWVNYIPHIFDMVSSGKKVGVVMGVDKPTLRIHDKKYYTVFNDIMSCDITMSMHNCTELNPTNIIEFFYHTPKFPELIIKQVHLLKKTVERYERQNDLTLFENLNKFDNTEFRTSFICESKIHLGKNLRYDLYHKTIYPDWSPNIVTPKLRHNGKKNIDCWWVNKLDEKYVRIWSNGALKYLNSFSHLIKKTSYNFNNQKVIDFSTLPLLHSKKYYIE
jgi:hypothetical protein